MVALSKLEEREQAAEYLAQGVTQRAAAAGVGVAVSTVTKWTRDPEFMKLVTEGKVRINRELAPRYASLLMDAANVIGKHLTSRAVELETGERERVATAMKLVDAGLTPAWLARIKAEADARSD